MRASTVIRSMPTRKSRTHASMTIPLSRTRSKTSIGLLPPEARSMLTAIPFRVRPELHGHAAVSSSRRSRPPMCSMILHQVSKLIGLVRSASIRRCTDDTAEGDQRKTGKTFPISAWIQRWRDRVVSTGPRCRRGARSLRRGRTLRSPPVLVYKPCHHLRCGQKIAQPQGRFCLTVECACATNLRRSTQPEADVGVLKETFHTAISGRGIKDHARRHHRRSFSRCGTRPDRGRHLRHSRTLRHVPHAARVRRSDGDGWRSGG